jgi:selenocysteine lyase/cysteine desulfurase
MLTRRGLLFAGGAVAAGATAVTLVGCEPGPPADATLPPFDPQSWDSVRAQFVLSPDIANFTTFYLASHAATVRAAIDRHRAGLDADPYGYLHEHQEDLEHAVAVAAGDYLGTDPDLIAYTDSTTMGLGLLYHGMRLNAGDEILSTEHDFYSTNESVDALALRDGATVRRVRLYDEPEQATTQEMVHRLTAGVSDRTRVVAITWVHSSTGVKVPVRAIADALAARTASQAPQMRALLCVDGVHGFGIEDAGPEQLGCDFLVTGTHKWLFGPRGTGLIWGRREAWQRHTPTIPTFTARRGVPGPNATPGGFHTFEHRWALAEAFALHQAIGRSRVAQRTHELAAMLKSGLAGMPKVRLRTPQVAEVSAGLICCEVDGYGPTESVARLKASGVHTSATPYSPSYLRFGPSILTKESDVDKALTAVRAL